MGCGPCTRAEAPDTPQVHEQDLISDQVGCDPDIALGRAPSFYPGTYELRSGSDAVGFAYVACYAEGDHDVLLEDFVLSQTFPGLPPNVFDVHAPSGLTVEIDRRDPQPRGSLAAFLPWARSELGLANEVEHYQATVTYYRVCDTAFAGDPARDVGAARHVDSLYRGTNQASIYVTGGLGHTNLRRIHQIERFGADADASSSQRLISSDTQQTEQAFLGWAGEGDRYSRALVLMTPLAANQMPAETGRPAPERPTLAHARLVSVGCE